MFETSSELDARDTLFAQSFDRARDHLTLIISPDRRRSAASPIGCACAQN
jgi:hypothetical protein